ncbi:MAG: ABC transporter ATP-binding protein [Solirubrobacterales bacterium]
MNAETTVSLRGITKRFGELRANDGVNLELRKGEVHALLGENGAGKSTLMNVLSGVLAPDEGEIVIDREPIALRSPKHALSLGIGVVHQHSRLVDALTAAENLFVGWEDAPELFGGRAALVKEAERIGERFNLEVDMKARVWQLSVAEKQRLEILRTLSRGAKVLILDEPTAVLTPSETEGLFRLMREQRDAGETVVFISHKLPEVLEISDRLTVMRQGKTVKTLDRSEADVEVITGLMIGRDVPAISRERRGGERVVLEAEDLTVEDDRGQVALHGVSLSLAAGQITGVAGVTGNGQRELSEALAGLRKPRSGRVLVDGKPLKEGSSRSFVRAGVGFVPEDRLGTGLARTESIWRNAIMRRYGDNELTRGPFLSRPASREMAREVASAVRLSAEDLDAPVRALSGGHAQRLLTGRELAVGTRVLILAFPTRGLDVAAAASLRQTILDARDGGTAVLFISEELDEIIEMSDRVLVMYEGEIRGDFEGDVDRAAVGRIMSGAEAAA